MAECAHDSGDTIRHLRRLKPDGCFVIYLECGACRAWLSLGPANDTPEVLVEIRAAEIAVFANSNSASYSIGAVPNTEYDGWNLHMLDGDTPANSKARSGWLARAIVEHDESLRGVVTP